MDNIIGTGDFQLKEECYKVIGCAMNVHNELGCGFLEPVYQEALGIELLESEIQYTKEQRLNISYKGRLLMKQYIADFVCFNQLIVEVKAMEGLLPVHSAQVLNYLKATGLKVALLLNFGTTKLQYKRIIL
ncbi:MAG: GxxExxY protein [Bacteroidia bacterium]